MVIGTGGGGASEGRVLLRDVSEGDLPVFFEHQLDADAIYMAAFTAEDPSDRVAGHVSSFEQSGEREVTYGLGREYWGRGVATAALWEFLWHDATRPLYARVAKDNLGSIRVLQKCGFEISGEDRGFANARGEEVEEFVLTLGSERGPVDVSPTGHP
jgi:RimJ/RimL family protein N-acetyltransferase